MATATGSESDIGVAPECKHLVETIETLIEVGRRDQATSVMRLMRRCISFSDCPHVDTCSAALHRLEGARKA